MRHTVVVSMMIVSAYGCEDGRVSDAGAGVGVDSGSPSTDGGGPSVSDAGRPDAGGTDAGGPAVCSAPDPLSDCVLRVPLGSFGPLTAGCLPRCSAETASAYRGCADQPCRNAAIRADTTPGTAYEIGSASVSTPMDCEACVSYQEFHCFSLVCESEVDAYVDHCIAGVDPSLCDPSIAAIDSCLAALTPAEEDTVDACYASVDGPQGCFPCD